MLYLFTSDEQIIRHKASSVNKVSHICPLCVTFVQHPKPMGDNVYVNFDLVDLGAGVLWESGSGEF